MKLDVVITGVGGQGTILASRIIAKAAMDAGWQVRTSETIGMAQREGCVISHVRIGNELTGALIPDGEADVLLGFELAEAVRGLTKLKPEGKAIVNQDIIVPTSVSIGLSQYKAEETKNYLLRELNQPCFFSAGDKAREAGNIKAVNVVLLGAFSTTPNLPFSAEELLNSILETVPEKYKDINRQAFELGRQAVGGV